MMKVRLLDMNPERTEINVHFVSGVNYTATTASFLTFKIKHSLSAQFEK